MKNADRLFKRIVNLIYNCTAELLPESINDKECCCRIIILYKSTFRSNFISFIITEDYHYLSDYELRCKVVDPAIQRLNDEILKSKLEHKMMTRKEAIDRLTAPDENFQILANQGEARIFVDRLVALGLLKFEDEKIYVNVHCCHPIPLEIYSKGSEIINELVKKGYCIKKIEGSI